MPLYEHMIMALPKYPSDKLVTVFRKYAQVFISSIHDSLLETFCAHNNALIH